MDLQEFIEWVSHLMHDLNGGSSGIFLSFSNIQWIPSRSFNSSPLKSYRDPIEKDRLLSSTQFSEASFETSLEFACKASMTQLAQEAHKS